MARRPLTVAASCCLEAARRRSPTVHAARVLCAGAPPAALASGARVVPARSRGKVVTVVREFARCRGHHSATHRSLPRCGTSPCRRPPPQPPKGRPTPPPPPPPPCHASQPPRAAAGLASDGPLPAASRGHRRERAARCCRSRLNVPPASSRVECRSQPQR